MHRSQEIFEGVRDVLMDALGVDEGEVTRESKVIDDLGAESLDVLDIAFRLDKKFGMKIPWQDLWPKEIIDDSALYEPDPGHDGRRLTDRGVEAIRERMPWLDAQALARDRRFASGFTVGALCDLVDTCKKRQATAS